MEIKQSAVWQLLLRRLSVIFCYPFIAWCTCISSFTAARSSSYVNISVILSPHALVTSSYIQADFGAAGTGSSASSSAIGPLIHLYRI